MQSGVVFPSAECPSEVSSFSHWTSVYTCVCVCVRSQWGSAYLAVLWQNHGLRVTERLLGFMERDSGVVLGIGVAECHHAQGFRRGGALHALSRDWWGRGGHVFGTWSEKKRQTNERENVRLVGENYKYLAAYDVKTRTLTLINVLHSSKLLIRLSNLPHLSALMKQQIQIWIRLKC